MKKIIYAMVVCFIITLFVSTFTSSTGSEYNSLTSYFSWLCL